MGNMPDELPPDSDSLEQWERLPRNPPSKDALPPMVFRARWILWVTIIVAALIVIGLLLQARPA